MINFQAYWLNKSYEKGLYDLSEKDYIKITRGSKQQQIQGEKQLFYKVTYTKNSIL